MSEEPIEEKVVEEPIEEVKEPEIECPKCPKCGGDTAHVVIDEHYTYFICKSCLTRT